MRAHTYKNWTIEEEVLFKDYIEKNTSLKDIAEILKRTVQSLRQKMKKVKLKYSKEYIRKNRSARVKGKNNPMYGKQSWMKGKTKENNKIVFYGSKKLSQKRKQMYIDNLLPDKSGKNNPMYGKVPWNLGKTKYDSEIIRAAAEKTSKSRKIWWKSLSEIERTKHRQLLLINVQKTKANNRSTDIEVLMKQILNEIGLVENVDFFQHYYHKRYIFDFYLPKFNLVIECQGDYWHANPIKYPPNVLSKMQIANVARDKIKLQYLTENGFKYLFFWGTTEIKNDYKNTKLKIIKEVNL
jgi:G:T-mismatch repair DNA endonuclease (very short patch repair protein)